MEPLPQTIGRYVVEALVGSGAMGQIFRAHDPVIRRTVAIKLISTRLMSSVDRDFYVRRFRREAEAAARCVHANVVAIYDFALHEGEPFLAMEFVPGMSLRQALDERPVMAPAEAVGIILQVLAALECAHAQGVVHQDIKPANILLASGGQVKVSDFGVSRLVGAETVSALGAAGTPAYMSPQQCRGEAVDGRADLFAVGAMLFEMLAGRAAFAGRTVIEVSYRVQNARLPLLPAGTQAAAPRLQGVLERATAKQPQDRFDGAADMAAALRDALANTTDAATPIAGVPLPVAGLALDGDTLQLVEAKLRPHVGPIAPMMVRDALERSRSVETLVAALAQAVREGAERDGFRQEIEPLLQQARRDDAAARLSDQELARAQAALSPLVGPIAGTLVRQAAASASTVDRFWQDLAEQLESPAERTAFLRQREK